MLACILFVFGTLTEYAGILFAVGMEPSVDEYLQDEEIRRSIGIGPHGMGADSFSVQRVSQTVAHKW